MRLRSILSGSTALSMSAEILEQKASYYKGFLEVEESLNRGEATHFVARMLRILTSAQEQQSESLLIARNQLDRLGGIITSLEGVFTEYQLQILFLLGQVSLFGARTGIRLDEIAQNLGRSKQTVRPVMSELEDEGLIHTLNHRPLVFALSERGEEKLGLDLEI